VNSAQFAQCPLLQFVATDTNGLLAGVAPPDYHTSMHYQQIA